jgi:hypothetical protein
VAYIPTIDTDRCQISGCANPIRGGAEKNDSLFDHLAAAHGADGTAELVRIATAQSTELRETAARAWCQCCVFGNHTEGCTCASKTCCWHNHPDLTYRDTDEVSVHHFELVLNQALTHIQARDLLDIEFSDLKGVTIDPHKLGPVTVLNCAISATGLDKAVLAVTSRLSLAPGDIQATDLQIVFDVYPDSAEARRYVVDKLIKRGRS